MPWRRPLAAFACGVVVLLVAGGCAGGSGSTGASTSSTSTTSVPATTAPSNTGAGSTASAPVGTSSDALLATSPKVDPVLTPLPQPGPPLHVPVGGTGQAAPTTWPDACSLVSTAQLLSLVRSASAVKARGSTGRLGVGATTPHATTCTYSLTWAGAAGATPGTVTIELRAVASAKVLSSVQADRQAAAQVRAKTSPGLYADYGTSLGGASCFFDGTALECVDGTYSFWVGGTDPRPGPPGPVARANMWRNRVLARVVVLLVARMDSQEAAALLSS